MGQLDGSFKFARKNLKENFRSYMSYSKILAKKALNDSADYVAFGSFLSLG